MQGYFVELVDQGTAGPLAGFRYQDDHLGWTCLHILRQADAEGVVILDAAVKFDGSHELSDS